MIQRYRVRTSDNNYEVVDNRTGDVMMTTYDYDRAIEYTRILNRDK